MSELTNNITNTRDFRRKLLATVSALALTGAMCEAAKAEDADHPVLWIEMGGQLERMTGDQDVFAPAFMSRFDSAGFDSVLPLQRRTTYAIGEEAKISLSPENSDWVFSAAIRYGRSNGRKSQFQQLPPHTYTNVKYPFNTFQQSIRLNLHSDVSKAESHAVLDFKAGKDVGIGMFSSKGTSLVSLGVRFAQFANKNHVHISGVPQFHHSASFNKYTGYNFKWHNYNGRYYSSGLTNLKHEFRGIGPSISWDSSVPIAGQVDDTEITLDWNLNAAVLFGKQKVRGDVNRTSNHYKSQYVFNLTYPYYTRYTIKGVASGYQHRAHINRSHSVMIPNLGGSMGLSFHYGDAKVSFGYRADMFFGAMDEGTETQHSTDRFFHGPYASVSIGIGD